jgi:hypothetical protein
MKSRRKKISTAKTKLCNYSFRKRRKISYLTQTVVPPFEEKCIWKLKKLIKSKI